MNYRALHDYLYDISQNLDLTVKFFHGRKEWLNFTDQDKPLYIYSLPFTAANAINTIEQYEQTWNISLIFYQRDYEDSALNQNDDENELNEDSIQEEIRTITVTDQAADKFVRLFNENTISDDLEYASDKITLVSFTKQPVIKDTASMLTGTVLTITAQFADTFDYCSFLENNPPLTLTATGGSPIVLGWINQPLNSDIEIWRSLVSGSGFSKIATIEAANDSYNDTTAYGLITYYYKIKYINQDDFSNEASALSTNQTLLDASDLADSQNWYDAAIVDWKTKLAQDYAIPVSGDVATFEDRIAAKDIAQGLASSRPERLTNSIDFDGVDEWLDRSEKLVTGFPFTVFAVIKTTTVLALRPFIDFSDSSQPDVDYVTGITDGKGANMTRNATPLKTASGGIINDDSYHIVMGEWINSTSRKIWVDGVEEAESTDAVAFNAAIDTLTMGRFGDSTPGANYTGEVSESILSDAQFSTLNRQKMEGFLAHKWSVALPSGHPYEDTPPTT